jgi:hypothetical protein
MTIVTTAQVKEASIADGSHDKRLALIAYTAQNPDIATVPSRVPIADRAANADPHSSAMNTDTGAEVSGSPTMRPPREPPHLRCTKVAAAIRSGASVSFSKRMGIRGPGQADATAQSARHTATEMFAAVSDVPHSATGRNDDCGRFRCRHGSMPSPFQLRK